MNKSAIKKIHSLSIAEKESILNTLAQPAGYRYDPYEDIFATVPDAPQKQFGYTHFYDLSAPYFNIVFDYETFYFNYDQKTWLIEIWKGQYGINAGCELGIYQADTIVSPEEYNTTLFHAAEPDDMLLTTLILDLHSPKPPYICTEVARMRSRHWWSTIFKMGTFARPENLSVNTSIRFKDYCMMRSFADSFQKTLPHTAFRTNGLTFYFTFCQSSRKYTRPKRFLRCLSLTLCHFYCNLFNYLTKAFYNSGDKVLYLYYYLPFVVRLLFKPKQKNR